MKPAYSDTKMIRSFLCLPVLLLTLYGCSGEFPTSAKQLEAAKSAYDAQRLVASLNAIEAWHINNDTGLNDALGKGISPSSIEQAFSGPNCKPTEELKLLWSWRNGAVSTTPFVWYHDFLSLDDALTQSKSLRINPLVRWDPHYIPILTFDGEWYAAYCGPDAGTAGPIAHYFLEDEPRIVSVNLTVFMTGMAEAFESGAIQWQNEAMLEDIHQVHSIHQQRNPGYAFPYYVSNDN